MLDLDCEVNTSFDQVGSYMVDRTACHTHLQRRLLVDDDFRVISIFGFRVIVSRAAGFFLFLLGVLYDHVSIHSFHYGDHTQGDVAGGV